MAALLDELTRDWLALIGLALTALGGWITFWQTKKARTAAEAAKQAADKSLTRISQRFTLEEITNIDGHLAHLADSIRDKKHGEAAIYASTSRRALTSLRSREGFTIADADGAIDGYVQLLMSIETGLDNLRAGVEKPLRKGTLQEVREMQSVLQEWSGRIRRANDQELTS